MEASSQNKLVLWYSPIKKLYYYLCEIDAFITEKLIWILRSAFSYRAAIMLFILMKVSLVCKIGLLDESNDDNVSIKATKKIVWCLYWIVLGVLSSFVHGTGLHTLILYLGLEITKANSLAKRCSSLKFPNSSHPDNIVCPDNLPKSSMEIGLLAIMNKVRLEPIMWGIGASLGELVPYFVAPLKDALMSAEKKKKIEELKK